MYLIVKSDAVFQYPFLCNCLMLNFFWNCLRLGTERSHWLYKFMLRSHCAYLTCPTAPDGPTNNSSVDKTEGEEEVDFGYWESAVLESNPSASKSSTTSSTKDVDLDLL